MKKSTRFTALVLIGTILITGLSIYLATPPPVHAEEEIIIRKENKRGQGADIIIKPKRKNNKIEIYTRF